jgi:glycosyltransferase involved in cell wall biosynthesis
MKVAHVPFCFHPDRVGGTEIYVESVAREMTEAGVEIVIAAPGPRDTAYDYDGIPVRRFAVAPDVTDLRELYGAGDPVAARAFGRLLDDEQPDVVHLHALTRGVSLLLVSETKRRGIPVVFTYHTPTVSCQRGTLLHWGNEVCDGVLDVRRCASCTLDSLGVGPPAAKLLGRLPTAIGRLAGRAGLRGGPWTAVRMTELIALRHAAFRSLMAEVDYVIALCDWTRELLVCNGVSPDRISVSRHGLPASPSVAVGPPVPPPTNGSPLRVAFLGRMDPTKGAHILLEAVRSLPDARLKLDIYGVPQGVDGQAYLQRLQRLASEDSRVSFLPAVPAVQVVPLLRTYHLLAVPSQWLETGPLVVLEAFAAGIPIVGSGLGGIAELVREDVDGILVAPESVESWQRAFNRLLSDANLLRRLQSAIAPPRGMSQVATEMMNIYQLVRQYGVMASIPQVPAEDSP